MLIEFFVILCGGYVGSVNSDGRFLEILDDSLGGLSKFREPKEKKRKEEEEEEEEEMAHYRHPAGRIPERRGVNGEEKSGGTHGGRQ